MSSIKGSEKASAKCPNCGSTSRIMDYQQNVRICADCGRIIEESIKDRGPEWRAFSAKEYQNKKRSGPPSTGTIHDKGLSTNIDWKNRDAKGKNLSPKKSQQMYRLRKWHNRSRIASSGDRNLIIALGEMSRMTSQLGLPRSTQEIASKIYREAVEKGLIRGRSIEGVVSATLYAACREAKMPRTLEEIEEVSRVKMKKITSSYMFLTRKLDIHLPPTDPASYVTRFGSELGISGEVQTNAMYLIKRVQEKKLTSGKSPSGTAAACLYIAALKGGERVTQRSVAEVAGVTEVTVRNRYKDVAKELEIELETY